VFHGEEAAEGGGASETTVPGQFFQVLQAARAPDPAQTLTAAVMRRTQRKWLIPACVGSRGKQVNAHAWE
jgi:hypothetical protein